MVLNIKFVSYSLLYGYSCLWLVIQTVFPTIQWPNFAKTIHCHALLDIQNRWPKLKAYGSRIFTVHVVVRQIQIIVYLVYLTEIIFINLEVQKAFLEKFGIVEESELSYKAIYYAPVIQRICLLFISTVTALNFKNHEWLLYDKYDIFSFNRGLQEELFVKTVLIAIPDGFITYVEVVTLIWLVPHEKHQVLKVLLGYDTLTGVSFIDIPMRAFFALSSIVSFSVRYKPVLNIIYSANCVRAHLEDINNQIQVTGRQFDGSAKKQGFAHFKEPQDGPAEQQSRSGLSLWSRPGSNDASGQNSRQVSSTSTGLVQRSAADGGSSSGSAEAMQMKRNSGRSNLLATGIGFSLKDWLANQSTYREERIVSTSGKLSLIRATINPESNRQVLPVAYESTGEKHQSVCEIRNLHQLEYHICKLSFFVGDMDRCEALIVLSMCFLAFIQFIYGAFFLIEFSKYSSVYWQLVVCAISALTRLAIPLHLFSSGDRMERQARKLLANLEIIYLQDRSHSLIYKQYGSHTMAALARVIKLLKTIRFNCDKTMNINLATMRRFFLYAVTTMFIVVQYGKFNGSYNYGSIEYQRPLEKPA